MIVLLVMYNTGVEKIQFYHGKVDMSTYLKLLDIDEEVFESTYSMASHIKNKVMWFVEDVCDYRDTPSHQFHNKIKENLGLNLIEDKISIPNGDYKIITFVL